MRGVNAWLRSVRNVVAQTSTAIYEIHPLLLCLAPCHAASSKRSIYLVDSTGA